MDGVLRKGQRIRLMRGSTEHEVTEIGQFRPTPTVCPELAPGRSASSWPDQGPGRRPHRRHRHRRLPPDRVRAARLQGAEADGVQRALPGGTTATSRSCANRWQAAPQRRQLHLHGGEQRGPRLRLPLRLPRHVAPRDHPAAVERGEPAGTGADRPDVTYEVLTRRAKSW